MSFARIFNKRQVFELCSHSFVVSRFEQSSFYSRSSKIKPSSCLRPSIRELEGHENASFVTLPPPGVGLQKSFKQTSCVTDSSHNTLFKNTLAAYGSRTFRRKHKVCVLEGTELISAAVHHGLCVQNIWFSKQKFLDELPMSSLLSAEVQFYHLHGEHANQASQAGITSSVFATCVLPNTVMEESCLPVTLVCDNIRDPGNMSMLITSAKSMSCRQLLLTKGCVDVWDPKVLKSAGVALFGIEIKADLDWTSIENSILSSANCQVLVADCGLKSQQHRLALCDYDSISYRMYDSVVLVVGGETHGISPNAYALCESRNGRRVCIPMRQGVDSLNSAVSASIILYELHRQLSIK